jgi:hypothetical protein
VPELDKRSDLAEYWWRRLIRLGFTDEQLDRLRDEIRQHGLSRTEFYELLEARGAPAAMTFLNELRKQLSADTEGLDRARGQLRLSDIG